MRQKQDTLRKDQVVLKKKQIELLEVKNVLIEIKCSEVRLNIRLGPTEGRLSEWKEGPEETIQNATQRQTQRLRRGF